MVDITGIRDIFLAMVEGMMTRQKKVGQFQKELEKLDSKLDSTIHLLRVETHQRMDLLGADIKKVLELVMLKHDVPSKGPITKDYGVTVLLMLIRRLF